MQFARDIDSCYELGKQAQQARAQYDESRAKFHTDYMRRFVNARPKEQHKELREAFDAGYKAEYDAKDGFRRLTTGM
jgi:hypothetical protein